MIKGNNFNFVRRIQKKNTHKTGQPEVSIIFGAYLYIITSGYRKKAIVFKTMDYQDDIREKIKEKHCTLKMCTTKAIKRTTIG